MLFVLEQVFGTKIDPRAAQEIPVLLHNRPRSVVLVLILAAPATILLSPLRGWLCRAGRYLRAHARSYTLTQLRRWIGSRYNKCVPESLCSNLR